MGCSSNGNNGWSVAKCRLNCRANSLWQYLVLITSAYHWYVVAWEANYSFMSHIGCDDEVSCGLCVPSSQLIVELRILIPKPGMWKISFLLIGVAMRVNHKKLRVLISRSIHLCESFSTQRLDLSFRSEKNDAQLIRTQILVVISWETERFKTRTCWDFTGLCCHAIGGFFQSACEKVAKASC